MVRRVFFVVFGGRMFRFPVGCIMAYSVPIVQRLYRKHWRVGLFL